MQQFCLFLHLGSRAESIVHGVRAYVKYHVLLKVSQWNVTVKPGNHYEQSLQCHSHNAQKEPPHTFFMKGRILVVSVHYGIQHKPPEILWLPPN